jgi:bacteriocin biosynthesis cyclodehydratase domain-containing protein
MNDPTLMAVKYAETPLPKKPLLVPWVTLVDLGDERLQFRAAEFAYTLQSDFLINAFNIIKPLLDGRHTVEEIIPSGEPAYLPTTILFLLKMLRANGLLQEADVSLQPPLTPADLDRFERQLRFLSHFAPDSQGVLALLRQAKVGVIGSNLLKTCIQNSIRDTGIDQIVDLEPLFGKKERLGNNKDEIVTALKETDFLIACQESQGFSFFEAINEICLQTGTRWMRVAIEGTTAFLGPTIIPYQTACYACYDRRLNANLPDLDNYLVYKEQVKRDHDSKKDEGYFAPLWSLIAGHVAIEVVRILSGFSPPTTLGRFYEVNVTSPMSVGHDVLRLPRCPVCHLKGPRQEAWDSAPSSNENA